jgi:hypothetical protein
MRNHDPMKSFPRVCVLFIACMMVIAGCGGEKKEAPRPAAQPQKSEAQQPGNLTCVARLEGPVPEMAAVKMNADRKCVSLHAKPVHFQTVIANRAGMLENVFVYVKEGLGSRTYSAPASPVEIDQKGCMYEPHVMGIQVNQPLLIVNSDPVLHNIHALPKINSQFNVAQPVKGMKTEKVFTKPEVMVEMKCDVHSWMRAYIGVVNNPFYSVTDSAGACELKGLPPGQYVISAWHERYGAQERQVTVAPGESKKIEFTFGGG